MHPSDVRIVRGAALATAGVRRRAASTDRLTGIAVRRLMEFFLDRAGIEVPATVWRRAYRALIEPEE